jgi:hypothetical protein
MAWYTPQGVHHIALKEEDFSSGNGPYPTECLIMMPNGVNVKLKPGGEFPGGNTASKLFIEQCGHEVLTSRTVHEVFWAVLVIFVPERVCVC